MIEQDNVGRRRRALRRDATVLLFVIPALLLYGVYLLYPLVASIWYSFLDWNGIAAPTFTGLDNWRQLFQDSTVLASLRNTGIILLGSLLEIPIGLAVALVIQRLGRLGTVFSTIYVIPILISSIAVGVAWANIYDPQFGPL